MASASNTLLAIAPKKGAVARPPSLDPLLPCLFPLIFFTSAWQLEHKQHPVCDPQQEGPDAATARPTLLPASLPLSTPSHQVYLALETLSRLTSASDILSAIRAKKGTVTAALKGPDGSVRKKALDLLFAMCDASLAPDLVGELLDYLAECDYSIKVSVAGEEGERV
eukprot:279376-Chlamydomonas_euryale.AAC.1